MIGMSKFVRYKQCPKCAERGRDQRQDNCGVYDDGSEHCFANCGYHRFPKHYIKRNEEVLPEVKKVVPNDFSRSDIPAKAWKWLLQYGLGYRYWEPYCGYSEKEQRLILTVGQPTEFSIGRWMGEESNSRKWFAYGDCHCTAHVFGEGDSIVLVEDLISAHKVGQITSCIPLFGTKVFDGVVNVLKLYRKPVIMWLDKDQQDHARKRATGLSMLTGCDVRYVFTSEDPKCLSFSQIKEVLS